MGIGFGGSPGGGAVSGINVDSHPRAWVGISVALAAAGSFALANTSANVAYHGGSNPLTVAATRSLAPTGALIVWSALSGVSLILPRRELFVALFSDRHRLLHMGTAQIIQGASFRSSGTHFIPVSPYHRDHARLLGWEKFGWRTVGTIIIAIAGLALALDIYGSNLNIEGALLAFSSAVGLAVVVVFSSRVFRNGDALP